MEKPKLLQQRFLRLLHLLHTNTTPNPRPKRTPKHSYPAMRRYCCYCCCNLFEFTSSISQNKTKIRQLSPSKRRDTQREDADDAAIPPFHLQHLKETFSIFAFLENLPLNPLLRKQIKFPSPNSFTKMFP